MPHFQDLRRLLTQIAVAFAALPVIALADDGLPYPQFDGVYIKMDDGSFVEIPIRNIRANKSVSFQSGGRNSSELFREYYAMDDMASLPVIDLDNAGPVVIIGPPPNDLPVSSMIDTNLYFSDYLKDPSATVTYNDGTKKVRMRASDAPSLYTAGGCAPSVRIRRVEDFITEVYPDTSSGRWPKETTVNEKSRGCVSFNRDAVAFEVILNRHQTGWFLSADGVSASNTKKMSGAVFDYGNLPLKGNYAIEEGSCDPEMEGGISFKDGNRIKGGTIGFYDYDCRVARSDFSSGDLYWKVEAICTGEGTTFKKTMVFTLLDDGRFNFDGIFYKKCH